MHRIARLSFLVFFLSVSALPAAELPQLFNKAKEQFRLNAYAEALTTLAQLEIESQKPENQAYLASLRPPIAFYRGACLAALGRENEARENFEVFLAFSPNASLDPGRFPKKVVALFEQTRLDLKGPKERPLVKAGEEGSVAAAYRAYVPPTDGHQPELGEDWANGPVRCLLSPEERRSYSQLFDPVSRSEYVIAFWKARDPRPETPENEFREEFEKRIAFADSHFTEAEVRGSLTDRGMVFLLLGPPTYIGRKPITAGEDSSDPSGMSRFTRNDVVAVEKTMGPSAATNLAVDNMTGPGNKILDSAANWREIWHYRRELLPKGVPYQQVDFEFITRRGYGRNVLQREAATLTALEAARRELRDRSTRVQIR
jgi:GWxTD domain-containing protein